MSELPIDPAFYFLFGFHCLMGGIGALIAKDKGYNFWAWLLIGLVGGSFALTAALFMKKKE